VLPRGARSAHRWHHVTMMMRPPGAHTRASSRTNRGLSATPVCVGVGVCGGEGRGGKAAAVSRACCAAAIPAASPPLRAAPACERCTHPACAPRSPCSTPGRTRRRGRAGSARLERGGGWGRVCKTQEKSWWEVGGMYCEQELKPIRGRLCAVLVEYLTTERSLLLTRRLLSCCNQPTLPPPPPPPPPYPQRTCHLEGQPVAKALLCAELVGTPRLERAQRDAARAAAQLARDVAAAAADAAPHVNHLAARGGGGAEQAQRA
jgi:hypothetical protein